MVMFDVLLAFIQMKVNIIYGIEGWKEYRHIIINAKYCSFYFFKEFFSKKWKYRVFRNAKKLIYFLIFYQSIVYWSIYSSVWCPCSRFVFFETNRIKLSKISFAICRRIYLCIDGYFQQSSNIYLDLVHMIS